MQNKRDYVWGILRILMGWTFLWAFIDKTFGLGFATCRDAKTLVVDAMCKGAWINGGSPTLGFLKFGTHGPLAGIYQSMAGNGLVDWLFMLGLLLIGMALILGVGMRVSALTGSLLLFLMFTAGSLPPAQNPLIDQHIIYILVLIGLFLADAGNYLGLGKWWSETKLVQKCPSLR